MDFHPKTASVPSSYFPRAPRKDKPPSDFQEGVHDDIIVGRGHSGEIVGVEYEPRHSWSGTTLTLAEDSFLHSLETSRNRFSSKRPPKPVVQVEGDIEWVNPHAE